MEPIITSLLDNDSYNFKMSRTLWALKMEQMEVEYEFKCRSKIKLGYIIDEKDIDNQLRNLFSLTFTFNELCYLATMYESEYCDYLMSTSTYHIKYTLTCIDGELILNYRGPIGIAILYETPLLATINNLYYSAIMNHINISNDMVVEKGCNNIRRVAETGAKFIEFGTRRRASLYKQAEIIKFASTQKGYLGTSNVLLSMKYGTKPMGTQAHQWYMIHAAMEYSNILKDKLDPCKCTKSQLYKIKERMIISQKQAMVNWAKVNEPTPLLTDTYGTDLFLDKILEKSFLPNISGLRQDSGETVYRVKQLLEYFEKLGVEKTVMASDGLTPDMINNLQKLAEEKRTNNIIYGWGTNLTFDGIIKPISIVIKPKAIWHNNMWSPCVKLSDNINKATGTHEGIINIYKRIFNYSNNSSQETIY